MSKQDTNAPPPSYPPPIHQDAGPYAGAQQQDYYNQQTQPYNYYQQGQGPPQQGYYNQGYPPQQQGMYYQQQQPPQGYYADGRGGGRGPGASEGICAGLLGALACCCCLDFLF
ncbi:MAG: hypothetical protein LQ342_001792 [Letrouitia transgressa]|nr:MAG: hypothetical protein LQ342_001792 [Letrouitia transgressa]